MSYHHTLDPEPIPAKVLYINETELADLNKEAFVRRLRDIYRRYGYPTYKNESDFWVETQRTIAQLEIYDQIWAKLEGELPNGHSKKATEAAREMIVILQEDEGCAECFPYEIIDDLKAEYDL